MKRLRVKNIRFKAKAWGAQGPGRSMVKLLLHLKDVKSRPMTIC